MSMNKRWVTGGVFLMFLASSPAVFAAPAGSKKKEPDKAASTTGDKAKVQKLSAGGPQLQYEQFRKSVEMKVNEKREEQITGLQRLLDLGPKENEVPDIKFRLAELFYE